MRRLNDTRGGGDEWKRFTWDHLGILDADDAIAFAITFGIISNAWHEKRGYRSGDATASG